MRKRGRGSFQFLPPVFCGNEVKDFVRLNSERGIQAEHGETNLEKIPDPFLMLREAISVEPGGDFAARIRARVAESPRESRALLPKCALAGITCAVLAVIAMTVWREPGTAVVQAVLPHRDLRVLAPPRRVLSPPPLAPRFVPAATDVVVSRSEMLALQQLFSGTIVAPPPLLPQANELSIPELLIEPLVPSAIGPEGERQ